MTQDSLRSLLSSLSTMSVAVVGDFCLDRYLEIDALHTEHSIETGLPVYKVDRVRAQPGAAGTVLKNLVALGVGKVVPVGFCGDDGEGYELTRAIAKESSARMDFFLKTAERRTFTYCKPLLISEGQLPRELNRLDSKNTTATPDSVVAELGQFIKQVAGDVDAVAVMDQVDVPGSGVVCAPVLHVLAEVARTLPVLADSRSGLGRFPAMIFKLNRLELSHLSGLPENASLNSLSDALLKLCQKNEKPAFATLAENGILGVLPGGKPQWRPSLPLRGPIDIVGAGDSVTAALTVALAAGAALEDALELAMLAASVTVHQVGTTGEARAEWILQLAAGI